jgi:hypothetical protein
MRNLKYLAGPPTRAEIVGKVKIASNTAPGVDDF